MNQDSDIISSEASGSRLNLESESRSKQHNKKGSSKDNAKVEHIIVSENNEDDDDSNNEDADRLEPERIMVPSDPSEWNSSHIASWISWCGQTFSVRPIVAILPSTGKELLKLSLRDWLIIGGGTGGRILARHLGYLHLQATGVHTPDLLQENEASTEVLGTCQDWMESDRKRLTVPQGPIMVRLQAYLKALTMAAIYYR